MIFSSGLLKIWSFQKVPRRHMIFLALSGKMVFFSQKHDLFALGRKRKTAFPSRKYMETWCIAQQKKKQETWYIKLKFGLSLNLSGWTYSTMNNLQYLVPFSPQGPCSGAITRVVLQKKVFFEISQNSQENTCDRVSFCVRASRAALLKKRPSHRFFPVNFAKFIRTPSSQNTSGQLLLVFGGMLECKQGKPFIHRL